MQSPAAGVLQTELHRSSGAKNGAIRMTKRNDMQDFLNRSRRFIGGADAFGPRLNKKAGRLTPPGS